MINVLSTARSSAKVFGLAILASQVTLPSVSWSKESKASEFTREEAVEVFTKAKTNMTAAQSRQGEAASTKKTKCDEARKADDELLKAKPDALELSILADKAISSDLACEVAERVHQDATKVYQATRSLWRAIAADLNDCGKQDKECAAQAQAELVSLIAALRESDQLDPLADAKKLKKVDRALVEVAAGIQKRTADQRANAAAAYKVQDPLLASVLAARTADDKTLRGSVIRQGTAEVLQAVPELRAAALDAQLAANQVVRHALTLIEPCDQERPLADQHECIQQQLAARLAGADALARVEVHLTTAQDAQKRLNEGAALADAGLKWPRDKDRQAARRFTGLLDKYDDARSMLGENSALRLTADGSGGQATIKLAVGRALPSGFRSTTVILTSPTDDKGFTRLSSVDGLSRAASIEIGMKDLRASPLTPSTPDLIRQSGASIKFGVQPHSYIKSIDPREEVGENHKHWELSAFSAIYRLKAENPSVHIMRLRLQRTTSEETTETRCPVPTTGSTATTVTCVTGPFKPLEPDWRTLLSYQLRLQGDRFGFAPLFTYSARKDRRWEVELPLYFIPGNGKDAPLSAGLKLNWTNKPGDGKPKTRFGLFVGSTFDFWGSPE